jgi:hypothetical protein
METGSVFKVRGGKTVLSLCVRPNFPTAFTTAEVARLVHA